MASLVLGTRTADTKNDSVINVSAISEAAETDSETAGLRAGAFGTDSTARAEESSRLGRFAATGPPHPESPPGNTARRYRAGPRAPLYYYGFELSTTYYSSRSA